MNSDITVRVSPNTGVVGGEIRIEGKVFREQTYGYSKSNFMGTNGIRTWDNEAREQLKNTAKESYMKDYGFPRSSAYLLEVRIFE